MQFLINMANFSLYFEIKKYVVHKRRKCICKIKNMTLIMIKQ